jgi:type IV pilus assembly protein PilW
VKNNGLHKQAGFTIVELMVTMVIILLVAGGAYKVFNSSWTTYRVQESMSRIQENGRFAMSFLIKDARMAGFVGCVSNLTPVNTLNPPFDTSYTYDFSGGLGGFEAQSDGLDPPTWTWTPTVDASIASPTPLAGSDVLTLRGMLNNPVFIDATMPTVSADLKTAAVPSGVTPPVADGDIVMISDCTAAAVFQITDYNTANGNLVHNAGVLPPENPVGNETKDLGHKFEKGAEVFRVGTTTYYVGQNASGQPALYRKVGAANAQELVEGVETLQVLYGEDTNGDRSADVYRTANAVAAWSSVRSLRVGMLLRSLNEIPRIETNATVYNVLGTNSGPYNDRRLRRVFTSTVGVRNRLP